jgi:hypothetical protein
MTVTVMDLLSTGLSDKSYASYRIHHCQARVYVR